MAYIRQINTTVVVLTEGVVDGSHPALMLYPELFELVEGDIPEGSDFLHFHAEAADDGA